MGFVAMHVVHATFIAVVGFFVLFAAGKSSGIVRMVGTILGWWLWILAVLAIVCGVLCHGDGKDMPGWAQHMHGWMKSEQAAPAAAPATPAPVTDATKPAPAKPEMAAPKKP